LAQPKQVQLSELKLTTAMAIDVVTQVGPFGLAAPHLQVIDQMRGELLLTPINPRWARTVAASLIAYADQIEPTGGEHGSAAMHEQ